MRGLVDPMSIDGYEIADTKSVRDKLVNSVSVASIGTIVLTRSSALDRLAAKCIFVLAAGSAPERALDLKELVTTLDSEYIHIVINIHDLRTSILLAGAAILAVLVWAMFQAQ
eukprot:1512500-Amphidinium_carterae.1